MAINAVKEKYSLGLNPEAPNNKEFLRELEEKVAKIGAVRVTRVSEMEVLIEGRYNPFFRLVKWVLKKHLENVGHLKPAPG